MSHSNIEAYNNTIKGHKSIGIAVNSWLFTGVPFESEDFDPYSTNINLHDNIIIGTEGPTDNTTDYGKLMTAALGGQAYDIMIDGIFKPNANGVPTATYCFRNNGDVSFVNLNAHLGDSPQEIAENKTHDMSVFECTLPNFDTNQHDAWLASN